MLQGAVGADLLGQADQPILRHKQLPQLSHLKYPRKQKISKSTVKIRINVRAIYTYLLT